MSDVLAHQVATKALGGEVFISAVRDPTDGGTTFAVAYKFGPHGTRWLCRHRFPDADTASAAAIVLGDFLGAEVVL